MFPKLVVITLIMAFARSFSSELQSDFQETKTKTLINSNDGIYSPDEPEETTYYIASELDEDLNLIKKSNRSSIKATLIEQVEDVGDSTLESPEIMEEGTSEIFQDDNSTIDLIASQLTTNVSETSNEDTEDAVGIINEFAEGSSQEDTTLPFLFQSNHKERNHKIFLDYDSTIDLAASQGMTGVNETLNELTKDTVAFTTEVTEGIIQEDTTLPLYFQSKHEEDTTAIFQYNNNSFDLISSQGTTEATEMLNKQPEVKEGIAPEDTTFPFFFQSNNEMNTAKTFTDYNGDIDLIMSQGTTEVTKTFHSLTEDENAEIFQDDDNTIDLITNPQTTEAAEMLNEQTENTVPNTNGVTESIKLEYTKIPNVEMISSTRKPILTPNIEAIEGIIEFSISLAWVFVNFFM